MARRKFKVGDSVKVVGNIGREKHDVPIGRIGKIVAFVEGMPYPYDVAFRASPNMGNFDARELEAVK